MTKLSGEKPVVLALGAHPDDLELGCGGTLASLSKEGFRVVMAVVSIPNSLEVRKQESLRAGEILGCEVRFLVPNKTTRVEDLKGYQLVCMIDELIREFAPSVVLSHCQSNSHLDHRLVYDATVASQRVSYFDHYSYPPTSCRPMNLPFVADTFVDISHYLSTKNKAIYAHVSQFGDRSLSLAHVQELDRRNGILMGVEYAEGFQVERQQIDASALMVRTGVRLRAQPTIVRCQDGVESKKSEIKELSLVANNPANNGKAS